VETEAQVRFLRAAGVHYIQGFIYRHPGEFADLPRGETLAPAPVHQFA
jgi:EAL domain-containing protein (putative c-di-GMP-specific phosphodiesterase class I)